MKFIFNFIRLQFVTLYLEYFIKQMPIKRSDEQVS